MTTVYCWVQPKVGKSKKYKSKDGQNFKDKAGNPYNAPDQSQHQVREVKTLFGPQLWAFYMEGHQNPIPLNPEVKWRQTTNHDSDVDMLVFVTREALNEAAGQKLERQITMGGIALILFIMLIQQLI